LQRKQLLAYCKIIDVLIDPADLQLGRLIQQLIHPSFELGKVVVCLLARFAA
jgi:hypothetical protein